MAGIGFQLRKLSRQDTLSSVVAAAGHAAVIAAGPWLFTILSLATITLTAERVTGLEVLATFRIVIIYAFAVSLVLTAPVTMVATRLVADALWLKQPERVPALLLGAFALALAVLSVGVAILIAFFQPPAETALVLAAASMLVGLIWVVLSFCGAVRDYRGVTLAFLYGLIVSVAASITAAVLGYGATAITWGFLSGLGVTFFGLTRRVLATFPQPVHAPLAGLRAVIAGLDAYWRLALGALLGTLAVWIDKWIFWFSPEGERLGVGLYHAPLYDSAMFIASLGIIPALSAFVLRLETDFFERYQQYYATIASHGTYTQIEGARERMHIYTLDNLTLISVLQIGICAVMILTAPLVIETLGLQFRQISILRYGALGAVFQFVFIACSAMLLFFDRRRMYLLTQLFLFGLMAGLTMVSLRLGPEFYGVGYFLACVIGGFVAYFLADRTFTNLNFLTFVGNNPSIEPASLIPEADRRPGIFTRIARWGV
ncbi:MAG: exopolysaccharide Pel transporter PelG [Hyphomicrobiaceae bacterium]